MKVKSALHVKMLDDSICNSTILVKSTLQLKVPFSNQVSEKLW